SAFAASSWPARASPDLLLRFGETAERFVDSGSSNFRTPLRDLSTAVRGRAPNAVKPGRDSAAFAASSETSPNGRPSVVPLALAVLPQLCLAAFLPKRRPRLVSFPISEVPSPFP